MTNERYFKVFIHISSKSNMTYTDIKPVYITKVICDNFKHMEHIIEYFKHLEVDVTNVKEISLDSYNMYYNKISVTTNENSIVYNFFGLLTIDKILN